MRTVDKLQEYKVGEDQELLSMEKETYLRFSAEEKNYIKISTDQKEIMEYMLNTDEINIKRYYIKNDNIVHLEGVLPISYIRFKESGAESMNYLSRVLP